jgi:TPR repeat protein
MTLAEHAMREKNRADAKLYTEKACNYGLGTGCQFRVVVEEDEQNALPWMEKGCAIGEPWSCAVSGGIHLKRGDAAKGFVYATRSCDLGDADGCNLLAKMYLKGEGTTKNGLKAIAIHEKQCKAGWVNACEAGAKELEEGKNVKKDLVAAEKILVMACDASNANAQHANVRGVGCLWLASFYERRSDAAKATKAYEQACSIAKLPAACNKVAKN